MHVARYGWRVARYGWRATRAAFLEPTLNDDLGICKEIKNFLPMPFGVAEHRIAGTAEGKETHGRGNADVNSDHAGFRRGI